MAGISDLVAVLQKINSEYSGYDRLDYCVPGDEMTILTTVNVWGEPNLRRTENFADRYDLKFKRDYDFARGGEPPNKKPILYLKNIPLDKDAVKSAAMSLVNLKGQLYSELCSHTRGS